MSRDKKTKKSSFESQVSELTEALKRERADAENMRRRYEEQIAGLKDSVKIDTVKQLLPVVDNFERALKHTPKDIAGHDYVKGVNSVAGQFDRTLSDIGVKKIETVGKPFDPNLHEAVGLDNDPSPDSANSPQASSGQEAETVVEELQPGYMLGDKVIRHAMVKVGR